MKTKEEILRVFTSKEAAWNAYMEGLQEGLNESLNSLRNQAAIAAMQGLAANPMLFYDNGEEKVNIIARARRYAEELVKE